MRLKVLWDHVPNKHNASNMLTFLLLDFKGRDRNIFRETHRDTDKELREIIRKEIHAHISRQCLEVFTPKVLTCFRSSAIWKAPAPPLPTHHPTPTPAKEGCGVDSPLSSFVPLLGSPSFLVASLLFPLTPLLTLLCSALELWTTDCFAVCVPPSLWLIKYWLQLDLL